MEDDLLNQMISRMSAESGMPPKALMQQLMNDPEALQAFARDSPVQNPPAPHESEKRADGNAKFKSGDLEGAIAAYEKALEDPEEDRLPLLSNVGLCHLKRKEPAKALAFLREAMTLTVRLHASPKIATKAAARRYEAEVSLGDIAAMRAALADLRYYTRQPGGSVTGLSNIPDAPAEEKALQLIVAIVNGQQNDSGLWQIERLLEGVPAEACDKHGNNPLSLSVEVACATTDCGSSFGFKLVQMLLKAGTPPDVRQSGGKTPLMAAANKGRADICGLLLKAGASATATDREGFSPLHTACVDLSDPDKGPAWVADHEAVVAMLLARGANVNAQNAGGMNALMYCAQQLRGTRKEETGIAKRLIEAGATTTIRIMPEHAKVAETCIGFLPIGFVVEPDAPMRALLTAAAAAEGAAAVEIYADDRRIEEYLSFSDEYIKPVHNKGAEALRAAGVEVDDTDPRALRAENKTPEQHRASILQETLKAIVLVGRFAGLTEETMYDVVDNPLLTSWTGLQSFIPRILLKRWPRKDAPLTYAERGEICRLWGKRQERKMLSRCPSTNALVPFFVVNSSHQDWLSNFQHPLQHTYACAIPNNAALDAISSLGMPLMELGAGAGYWGALLRSRGVECVLYDRAPPTADGNNMYFHRQFTEVLLGDHSKAATHPGHALLLVWPFSDEEAKSPWARDVEPWDVRALRLYGGSTVIHVGEMDEQADVCTTSKLFKQLLTAAFRQVRSIDLPTWPHGNDVLTIWRRAGGAVAG